MSNGYRSPQVQVQHKISMGLSMPLPRVSQSQTPATLIRSISTQPSKRMRLRYSTMSKCALLSFETELMLLKDFEDPYHHGMVLFLGLAVLCPITLT